MPRHAAFLRGMNLGRHRRIGNEQLRDAVARLGAEDVATFRASGNVAFSLSSPAGPKLVAAIERALEQALGFPVPTFLRSASAVAEIAAAEPFAANVLAASRGKLQVCLLGEEPDAEARNVVRGLAGGRDAIEFAGRELYGLPAGGVRDSALDMATLGRALGPMTVRTKATIEQFVARCFSA
jgi:uncharacterized protein (DUF1697 family)